MSIKCTANIAEHVNSCCDSLLRWYQENRVPFWAAYALTLVAYSYFFTQLGFSNHTFPQVWTYSFPSYRTTSEGRWFSDLLLWALGGVGVSSTQMYIAAALHVVNAILFAEIIGVKSKPIKFVAAAFLSVYPTFIDRYIFPGSQIIFVFTDTLAIMGTLVLARQKNNLKALAGAALLFFFCMASYQPNIALALFLVLCHCVLLFVRSESHNNVQELNSIVKKLLTAASSLLLAAVVYYVSIKLTMKVMLGSDRRANLNSISEMLNQIPVSYSTFFKYYFVGADYLPKILCWLPLFVIFLGAGLLVVSISRRGCIATLSVIFLLCLIPVALHTTYILNANSFVVGRIIFPYGYALLFFLLVIWNNVKYKLIPIAASFLVIYFSTIVVAQETNAVYHKIIYDINKINRVAQRIEMAVPNLYKETYPIVIVGKLNYVNQERMKLFQNKGNPTHLSSETFILYRQTEILNYYFGKDIVVLPTVEQRDSVLANIKNRRSWPAPESVYVENGVIVVLLEDYQPGVHVTWTKN